MRVSVAAALIAALLTSAGIAEGTSPPVSKQLEQRALAVLRDALANGKEWVKVHAAESLVWTGHPEGVYKTFLRERDSAEPPYRIGVWRVLAQSAPSEAERQLYRDRILKAFLDSNGPDRLHAVETLAKLGCAVRPEELLRVANEETGSLQAYARWVLANSGAAEDETAFVALLDAEDKQVCGCVAYGLRFFDKLRPASRAKLRDVVTKTLPSSVEPASIYLLGAWFVHGPARERPKVKPLLVEYAERGTKGEKREACAAFGRVRDPADVPLLTRLLDDAEMDVRAGAAETLLRITRGQRRLPKGAC